MNQHSMNRGPDSYNNGSVRKVPPVRKCLKSRGGFPPSEDGFRTARSHGPVGRFFCRSKPTTQRCVCYTQPSKTAEDARVAPHSILPWELRRSSFPEGTTSVHAWFRPLPRTTRIEASYTPERRATCSD